MELKGKKVLFLGDSITNGHCASSRENRWTDVFTRSSGVTCAGNFGVNGTRIARQTVTVPDKEAWDEPFTDRVDRMPPEADIVLVFGGTNDWGHGDAPFGTPDNQTDDTFCGALNVLYRKLIAKYPTARIVALTPLHRAGEDSRYGSPNRRDINGERPPLKEYVSAIRAACERYAIPVCDLYRISGIAAEVPEQASRYLTDGLHPNDAGYARIAEVVESFLRAL